MMRAKKKELSLKRKLSCHLKCSSAYTQSTIINKQHYFSSDFSFFFGGLGLGETYKFKFESNLRKKETKLFPNVKFS